MSSIMRRRNGLIAWSVMGGSCLEGGLQLLSFRQDAPLISPHPAHLAAEPYRARAVQSSWSWRTWARHPRTSEDDQNRYPACLQDVQPSPRYREQLPVEQMRVMSPLRHTQITTFPRSYRHWPLFGPNRGRSVRA